MAEERRDRRPNKPNGQPGGRRPHPASSAGGKRPQRSERSERPERPPTPPGLERRANEPRLPADIDTSQLHRAVRAELRGLPKDLAEVVAGHLVLAGQLIDTDPESAYGHAEAARRRAARLPIAREATAETAYAAGRYDVALSEFRALRRMTGMPDYLPVMADCERALGRPHAAIKLAKEARTLTLDPVLQIEMIIVEAGARTDLDQATEGLRLLAQAVGRVRGRAGTQSAAQSLAVARLQYAYADALLAAGDEAKAREWFASAADLDADGSTDADERRDALDGLTIDFDDAEDPDSPGDNPG